MRSRGVWPKLSFCFVFFFLTPTVQPTDPCDSGPVAHQDKGNEYFMISPKGIVHICPGKQSEHTTLTSWLLGSPNRCREVADDFTGSPRVASSFIIEERWIQRSNMCETHSSS